MLIAGCAGNLPWEQAPKQEISKPQVPPTQTGIRIAVVLPTADKNAALGKAMLNAAILANYDIHNPEITLIPMDQNSVIQNPALLTTEHVNATVGPLTAEATRYLQPFAKQNSIRIFSLSNDPSLSDDNTLALGYSIENEVSRILNYANSRYKNRILAVIHKDAYGDAIAAAVPANQVAHTQIIRFDNSTDLQVSLKGVLDIPDAIFIPISAKNLSPVLTSLAAAGLTHDKAQYISTGVWDDDTTRQIPELDHAWYPSADPARLQSYSQHYAAQYGAVPPRLSALSYNAVAMIAILEKQSITDPFNKIVLTNPSGFEGVDGLFRIMPDGSVRRALAIVEIQNHQPTIIQSPPDSTALAK